MFDHGSPGDENRHDLNASAGHASGGISAVTESVDALVSIELAELDDRELMACVETLETVRRRVDAVTARAIARLDATGATERYRGLRTKGWKANRCHLPHRAVARDLRVGVVLRQFDALDEALGIAQISIDHVDAVASVLNPRIEAAMREVQGEIIKYATRHRFTHFKSWLGALAELLDSDGPEPDHRDRNTASMAADDENLHLVMELSGADAVVARHLIDAETDRQFHAATRECEATGEEMPSAPQLRARAIVELLRRGAHVDPSSPSAVTEAVITVPVDQEGNVGAVHTRDGQPLDAASAAVLMCDALLQPVGVGPGGDPLRWGRRRRLFTSAQRTALAVRDGGCAFPGCDQPVSRCDAHHLLSWEAGGSTDLSNGVLLCRRHHRLEHSNSEWKLHTTTVAELPARLAAQHRQRIRGNGPDPGVPLDVGVRSDTGDSDDLSAQVRIWTGPDGQTLLAQIAADHHPLSTLRE